MYKYLSKWLSIILMLMVSGCVLPTPEETDIKDEDATTTEDQLNLPPQLSFVMNFSAMDSTTSGAASKALSYYDYGDASMDKVIQDYTDSVPSYATQGFIKVSNHDFAAARVAAWNLLTVIGMAVPTVSFVKAFEVDPTSLGDGKWQWAYSVKVGLHTFNARLVGQAISTEVNWEMYLSRGDGEFTDVNWYSGTHNLAATSGSWTIRQRNNSTGDVSGFIDIDWERNLTNGTHHIRYTNPADEGYIENGITTDTTYDAYFNIDNKEAPALINIEWNSSDLSGRVRSSNIERSDHFGHADWNCWDTKTATTPFADIDCS